MKIKQRNIFGMALMMVIFLSACSEDFLNRYPQANPSPENFFADLGSAKSAAVAAYNPWVRNGLSNMHYKEFIILSDALTDDSDIRLNGSDRIQMRNWEFQPNHGIIGDWWQYIYQSVHAANYAIENIPSLLDKGFTQEQIDPFIAEARFIRGYDYLVLVTFFGEVPLITNTLKTVGEYSQPKASTEAIYEQIISDFTFAKENLPDNDNAYKGTPTQSAGAAFLAKTYLYKKDFEKAETAARAAIEMAEANGYGLVEDYEIISIFDESNEGNKELLFYFPFVRNNENYSTIMSVERGIRDIPGQLNHIQGGEGWGYALPTRDLYDAFEEGDSRRGYTIIAPGDTFGIYQNADPFTYTHSTYNESGELITHDSTYSMGDHVMYDFKWSPTGMNVRKLTENVGGLTNVRYGGMDIPIMRMADLYLILAEALAEQGEEEALVWVNKVRERVDMPDKTVADGSLVDIVRHERRVEFGMEGQRIFDLLRWDMVKDVFGDGTEVKLHFFSDYLTEPGVRFANPPGLDRFPEDQVFLPIPQYELDQNSEINANNPGY